MKKVIKGFATLLTVSFALSSMAAFAEIPDGTVVIGDKAYSLDYANSKENEDEIRNAIRNHDGELNIFVKTSNGTWYNNDCSLLDGNDSIPKVLFKNSEGTVKAYATKDGEEISAEDMIFKVESMRFNSLNNLDINFSHKVISENLKDFVKINEKNLGENGKAELSKDGKTLNISLGNEADIEDLKLFIDSTIFAEDGQILLNKIDKEMLIVNSEDYDFAQKEINKDVHVLNENLEIKDIKINGNLVLGSENSKVTLSGNTEVTTTEVLEAASLNQKGDATFGKISVKGIDDSEKVVKLTGKFTDEVLVRTSCTLKVDRNSKVDNLVIHSLSSDESVVLDGVFKNVVVEGEIKKLHLADGCKIEKLEVQEKIELTNDGSVHVGEIISDIEEIKEQKFSEPVSGGGGGGYYVPPTEPTKEIEKYNKVSYELGDIVLNIKTLKGSNSPKNAEVTLTYGGEILEDDKAKITLLNKKGEIIDWQECSYKANNKISLTLVELNKGNYKLAIRPKDGLEKVTFDFEIK